MARVPAVPSSKQQEAFDPSEMLDYVPDSALEPPSPDIIPMPVPPTPSPTTAEALDNPTQVRSDVSTSDAPPAKVSRVDPPIPVGAPASDSQVPGSSAGSREAPALVPGEPEGSSLLKRPYPSSKDIGTSSTSPAWFCAAYEPSTR